MRSNLECRRIAAYVLNAWTKAHRLGNKAHVFMADQFDEWQVRNDWQVDVLIESVIVGEVSIYDDYCLIHIVHIDDIIRPEHYSAFEPHEHDLERDPGYWPVTLIPFNDVEAEVRYARAEIPGIDAPEQRIYRQTGGRAPRVVASR